MGTIIVNFDKNVLTPMSVTRGGAISGAFMATSNLEDESTDVEELDFVKFNWVYVMTPVVNPAEKVLFTCEFFTQQIGVSPIETALHRLIRPSNGRIRRHNSDGGGCQVY